MARRHTVAAVIPTKNVAAFITGTLESLWFCDEVIVVDMHSTDGTRAVCEKYPNVRFFVRDDYIYGNFNFGVEQARSDWIIRLDSDERLSPALADEIIALLGTNPECDYWDAPFISYIDGNPIRHGMAWEQPMRKTLFRRGVLAYRVRSEHEDLTPTSDRPLKRGLLREPYHHFSTPSISTFWRKIDYYTDKDYERAVASQVRVTPPIRLLCSMARRFWSQYVLKRGYRDGYAGFVLCAMNQAYRLLHEFKGWEFKHDMRRNHTRTMREFDRRVCEHAERRRREIQPDVDGSAVQS
jgi:glycosyltransferase involved in cell wall biosynthesis